jgi:hypothetical protein
MLKVKPRLRFLLFFYFKGFSEEIVIIQSIHSRSSVLKSCCIYDS